MLNNTERHVLVALFRMARHNRHATAIRLANAVGITPLEGREVLAALEAKGLVDAERVRVTLNGLVVATSLAASVRVAGQRTGRAPLSRAA
jgi:hypothetical protein